MIMVYSIANWEYMLCDYVNVRNYRHFTWLVHQIDKLHRQPNQLVARGKGVELWRELTEKPLLTGCYSRQL